MSECESAACLVIALILDEDKKKRGPTRLWIRRREEEGMFSNLVQELLVEDTKTYREMMIMNYESFKQILGLIEPYITPKQSTIGTKIVNPAERLVLTIQFLAKRHSKRRSNDKMLIRMLASMFVGIANHASMRLSPTMLAKTYKNINKCWPTLFEDFFLH